MTTRTKIVQSKAQLSIT